MGIHNLPSRLTQARLPAKWAGLNATDAGIGNILSITTTSCMLKANAITEAFSGSGVTLNSPLVISHTSTTTSVSSGAGSIKMTTTNASNSAIWIAMKVGSTTYYLPGFATTGA